MSEWISKAANVFKRDVSEAPQGFIVFCECGMEHTGVRRIRHQHLVCKGCGAALFVLPQDTYPPPHIPSVSEKSKKKRKKKRSESIDLAASLIVPPYSDELEVQPIPGDESTEAVPRKTEVDDEEVDEDYEPQPNIIVRSWLNLIHFLVDMYRAFWEFWTPYRKLAAVICCLLCLTAYFSIRKNLLRDAASIAKREMELGLEDLSFGEWVQARQHFSVAADAVEDLGRDDLEANTIRQYFRETTALTRLSSESLFEVMEYAEGFYTEHGKEDWEQEFRVKYKDDWYVIEGYLRPTVNNFALANGYELELVFPMAVGVRNRSVLVHISFHEAINLPKISPNSGYDDDNGIPTVFGAQLSECFLGPNGQWVVRFNPDTSFFWVNRPTYEATHLNLGSIQNSNEQQMMFDQQAKWMGVKQ